MDYITGSIEKELEELEKREGKPKPREKKRREKNKG